MEALRRVRALAVAYQRPLLWLLCVVAPLPLLLVTSSGHPLVGRAAWVAGFMSVCWALQPVSLYVVSLFPLALLPLLGLLPSDAVAAAYWNDAILLFFGSFVLTCAMERWMLHKRLALRIVLAIGNRPRIILLGIVAVTAFISMWISNTATAALMVPLVLPIIRQLPVGPGDAARPADASTDVEEAEQEGEAVPAVRGDAAVAHASSRYAKSLLLAVAYSASLGGVGTLIGTGPNLVLVQMLATLYPGAPGLSFAAWMAFALPLVVAVLAGLWAYLALWYNRGTIALISFDIEGHYRGEYAALGAMKIEEMIICADAAIMALLWLTRTGIPPAIPGWGSLFGGYVRDGTVSIVCTTPLFLIPSFTNKGETILEVSALQELNWPILLLLGSGFAIAKALVVSGLTQLIAQALASLQAVPIFVAVLVVTFVASFWTEVCSNVATTNILLPIVGALAVALGNNPLLLMVPVTVACSMAFMLPVGTPPNALAMSAGVLDAADMLKVGLVMKASVLLLCGWIFVGGLVLGIHYGVVPAWVNEQ